eukprot:9593287-Prorocentrum_lima.AAC.1
MIPIPKGRTSTDTEQHRGISLMSCLSKVMGCLVCNEMNLYMRAPLKQFAAPTSQVKGIAWPIQLVRNWAALDGNVAVVFFDITKAFGV